MLLVRSYPPLSSTFCAGQCRGNDTLDCTGKLENSTLSPSECTEIFNVLDQKLAIIDLLTQIGNGKADFDSHFSYLAIE
jgi:hypothetical protein